MDTRHRRSISGILYMLAGGAIAWKCRVQPTVSLSSTEAELLCATDAGRMALCLRTILDELGVNQSAATVLYEDNRGALLVANAGQPPVILDTLISVNLPYNSGSTMIY